ncbi:MAG TPA: hypothetical protein VKT73_15140 [Xanthobacteraceae bacterium]|nr:hypothetical protein [Xanthobacteraceae bacterium]
MALDTVADYVSYARVLLQDQVVPYRYPDNDLVQALNIAVFESRRLRPDLYIGGAALPSFSAPDTTAVAIDPQYRMAFVYFMCGHAQLRDEENTQDARASEFLNKFSAQMVSIA